MAKPPKKTSPTTRRKQAVPLSKLNDAAYARGFKRGLQRFASDPILIAIAKHRPKNRAERLLHERHYVNLLFGRMTHNQYLQWCFRMRIALDPTDPTPYLRYLARAKRK